MMTRTVLVISTSLSRGRVGSTARCCRGARCSRSSSETGSWMAGRSTFSGPPCKESRGRIYSSIISGRTSIIQAPITFTRARTRAGSSTRTGVPMLRRWLSNIGRSRLAECSRTPCHGLMRLIFRPVSEPTMPGLPCTHSSPTAIPSKISCGSSTRGNSNRSMLIFAVIGIIADTRSCTRAVNRYISISVSICGT